MKKSSAVSARAEFTRKIHLLIENSQRIAETINATFNLQHTDVVQAADINGVLHNLLLKTNEIVKLPADDVWHKVPKTARYSVAIRKGPHNAFPYIVLLHKRGLHINMNLGGAVVKAASEISCLAQGKTYIIQPLARSRMLVNDDTYKTLVEQVDLADNCESPYLLPITVGPRFTRPGLSDYDVVHLYSRYCIADLYKFVKEYPEILEPDSLEMKKIAAARARGTVPELFLLLALDILCGVKALHDHGILHRDLKLQNVLIKNDLTQQRCCAVICDYDHIVKDSNPPQAFKYAAVPYASPQVYLAQVNPLSGVECAKLGIKYDFFPEEFLEINSYGKRLAQTKAKPATIAYFANKADDMWAVGLTLFYLLRSANPQNAKYREDLSELLTGFFTYDETERLTVDQAIDLIIRIKNNNYPSESTSSSAAPAPRPSA